jgi:hypothetical protein
MPPKNIFDNFDKFLRDTDGDCRILEHQVPIETQMEYFVYSQRLRELLPEDSEMAFDQFASVLFDSAGALSQKKTILSALAVSKEVRAYRMLQEYVQNPDKELKDWAQMALMESRVILESELTDERQVYISSGLGGKGNKMRFYILLLSATGKQLVDYQQQVIEREFAFASQKEDCEIEELTIKTNYIELMLLAPIQKNIKRFIEKIVTECNQYGDFIANTITITNVKKLSGKEIAQIIKKHENIQTSS